MQQYMYGIVTLCINSQTQYQNLLKNFIKKFGLCISSELYVYHKITILGSQNGPLKWFKSD